MDEGEIFLVERIVGKGVDENGATVFRVKWEGYGDEDNTWEPSENLDEKDIQAFEETLR